jgi:hypothetical protein
MGAERVAQEERGGPLPVVLAEHRQRTMSDQRVQQRFILEQRVAWVLLTQYPGHVARDLQASEALAASVVGPSAEKIDQGKPIDTAGAEPGVSLGQQKECAAISGGVDVDARLDESGGKLVDHRAVGEVGAAIPGSQSALKEGNGDRQSVAGAVGDRAEVFAVAESSDLAIEIGRGAAGGNHCAICRILRRERAPFMGRAAHLW